MHFLGWCRYNDFNFCLKWEKHLGRFEYWDDLDCVFVLVNFDILAGCLVMSK